MLKLEEVAKRLQDRRLPEVSRRTGVSYITVWRISTGRAENVMYDSVVKLSDYLEAPECVV